jgi:3,4-dihydroxy 2-butanone 4-phosphate synthase
MLVDIKRAIDNIKKGKGMIIFDKLNENEGDLVFPADLINEDNIIFMINNCKGVICQTLEQNIIDKFNIPNLIKKGNNKTGQTNFLCPLDHKDSHSGISSKDRLLIIKELINKDGKRDNIISPGHQNILKVSEKGLYQRQGHTESSTYLVKEAGFSGSAIICEIMNNEGSAMNLEEILLFSDVHNIDVIFLHDIYNYFLDNIMIEPSIKNYKNPYELLNNKKVVLTGGSSGIGKAIKEKLIYFNCNIISISRREGLDVTDYTLLDAKLGEISEVDILINCAGFIEPKSVEEMTLEIWNKHVNTNLTSIFFIINKLIPRLNNPSAIINITSPSAKKIRKKWSAYCCTKAALNSFTLNCAKELQEKNIYVNGISPSKTNTPMIKKLFPDLEDKILIDPEIISNLAIDIICESLINKSNGKIYEVYKNNI